jgi:Short repeat of unknown function (DUF308)
VGQRGRRLVARALVVAASAFLVLALVAGYVRRAAVDSDQFANRATAALRDESVRALVAERVTDDVVLKNEADLITARPIIQSVASGIVGSRAFTGLFRSAVRDVHRALFDRDRDTVTLTVADVGTVLAAALERVRPSLARELESTERVALLRRDVGSVSGDLARLADRVRVLAVVLLALALALVAGALAVSRDRRRTVVELGVGVAGAGVLLVVAYGVARSLAIDQVEGAENRAAAGAVWDAFLGDLRTAAWILAGSGAVIAAAAASLIRPVDLREPLRRAAGWLAREPSHPALRVLRGVGLLAAGVLVLVEPEAMLRLLVTVLGVYLIYEGVTVLLRLVYRPPAPGEEAPRPRISARVPLPGRRLTTGLLAAALIVAAVATFVSTGGTTTAAPPKGPCNGHEELCDRQLDRVVLPATHNAMSVPLPGWYSSQQDRPIADQLADGVRGLLIDTHYADRLPNGRLRTYFGGREQLRRQAEQDGLNADAVDAALRIRDRLGFAGEGERGMYLCHTFCELGGTPLESVLDDLRDYLVAHPNEVVVVINQDYVTPADFVAAVKDAELEGLVYRGPIRGDWLTLRQMIDRNQRVLFLAENQAGAEPWYRPAYESITEETPFAFTQVAELTEPAKLPASCEPGRGPAGAPLFLVNHWITTDPVPLPSNAAKVNAYNPLLKRTRECQRLRKHLPNLVAVDFYRRGDLFRVVDTLNGVR